MDATLKLLMDLIAIPSVNPAFVESGHPLAGEQKVASFIADYAKKAGFEVTFQTVQGERSNVFVLLRSAGKTLKRVILAPHMDTVTVPTPDLLAPKISKNRLYGRGACDTKGSIAVMLSAMIQLANSPKRPANTEIFLTALVDEENGQTGSRQLVKSKFKADLAIVGEPTQLKVVTAHKGDLWLKFTTKGKAAHGARPELGKNAVLEMARVVCALEEDYAAELRKKKHRVLGSPTISVGTISGGVQSNIVPDHCEITADRRTIPGEYEEVICRHIQKIFRSKGIKAKISSTKNEPCLPMAADMENSMVQRVMKTMGQKEPLGVDYFCDASVLANGGIPSVVFGPGNIAQAHTEDEWIAISQLEKGRALLHRFLADLP
jgi:acetylornithine deacetylase/succinyl-diaminopimelate desuccinylase family protein